MYDEKIKNFCSSNSHRKLNYNKSPDKISLKRQLEDKISQGKDDGKQINKINRTITQSAKISSVKMRHFRNHGTVSVGEISLPSIVSPIKVAKTENKMKLNPVVSLGREEY
jgi:hypothetical protein